MNPPHNVSSSPVFGNRRSRRRKALSLRRREEPSEAPSTKRRRLELEAVSNASSSAGFSQQPPSTDVEKPTTGVAADERVKVQESASDYNLLMVVEAIEELQREYEKEFSELQEPIWPSTSPLRNNSTNEIEAEAADVNLAMDVDHLTDAMSNLHPRPSELVTTSATNEDNEQAGSIAQPLLPRACRSIRTLRPRLDDKPNVRSAIGRAKSILSNHDEVLQVVRLNINIHQRINVAKEIALEQKRKGQLTAAFVFTKCCKPLADFAYDEIVKSTQIIAGTAEPVTGYVYKMRLEELVVTNEQWQSACDEFLGKEYRMEASEPQNMWIEFFSNGIKQKFYFADLDGPPAGVEPLLNNWCSKDEPLSQPRFRLGSAGALVPLRVENGYYDSVFVIRHGAPRLWFAFPADTRPQLLEALHAHLREAFPNEEVCARAVEHRVYAFLVPQVTKKALPYTTFLQQADDVVWMRCGTYYMAVDLGLNLVESATFATPTFNSRRALLPTPCPCEESRAAAVEAVVNHYKVQAKQLKTKLLSCFYCELVFDKMVTLKKHLQNAHDGAKRFTCAQCRFGCDRPKEYERHLLTHQPQVEFCNTCNKSVRQLREHKRIHFDRKICTGCNKELSHRTWIIHRNQGCRSIEKA